MKSKLRLFRHSALSVALILCGCTVQPGQDLPLANKTLVNDNRERSDINALVRVTLLSPVMLQQLNEAGQQNRSKHIFRLPEDDYSYRIGVGDVLSITVWDHPEITSPAVSIVTQRKPAALSDLTAPSIFPIRAASTFLIKPQNRSGRR